MFNHTYTKDEKTVITDQKLDALDKICNDFKKLAPLGINSIPSKDFWRFFLDGRHQANNQTWVHYDTREPGYLFAMSLAFKYLLEHIHADDALNVEFIKKLHYFSLSGVDKTNYRSQPAHDKFEFDNIGYGFRIEKSTLTLESVQEILFKIKNGNPLINLQYGDGINDSTINLSNIDSLDDIAATAKDILSSGYIRLSGCLIGEDLAISRTKSENYFSDLITSFTSKINQKITQISKLKLIIELVRELEQSHPYIDGNGRTFCTLLLNYLLIRYQLPPVILDDPNRFDSMDNKTLTEDIIKGMKKTLELLQTSQLYGTKTDNLLLTYKNEKNNEAIEIYNNSYDILKPFFDKPNISATMKMK